jgi:hypothetical protein
MTMANWQVGDLAERIDIDLDARPVAEVSPNRRHIRLQIGTLVTDWIRSDLYRRIPQ